MSKDLKALRATADALDDAFDEVCDRHYDGGRWDAYRLLDAGEPVPAEVSRAMDAALAARLAFYDARDGALGFLGSRGL